MLTSHYIMPAICLLPGPNDGLIKPKHVANVSAREYNCYATDELTFFFPLY